MTTAKTILLVDDDNTLRGGLQAMLQHHGFLTLQAEDGGEAKSLIEEHQPDLVILDMMMPRWGGFAVLEHFQNKPAAPPFIMMTAHEGEKHKTYAKQIGAVDYLRKPFTMERLLQSVNHTLGQAVVAKPESVDSTSIKVCCPGCGARIKAPVQLVGQTRSCPGCGQAFVVREVRMDEGPRLLMDA